MHEIGPGPVLGADEGRPGADGVVIRAGATDHRPVEPTLAYRIEHGGHAVVVAGDTVPCATLDELCAGADALVITAIRKDVLEAVPLPRIQDVLDHSSVEEGRADRRPRRRRHPGPDHYVPALAPSTGTVAQARRRALRRDVVLGDDLTRVEIG